MATICTHASGEDRLSNSTTTSPLRPSAVSAQAGTIPVPLPSQWNTKSLPSLSPRPLWLRPWPQSRTACSTRPKSRSSIGSPRMRSAYEEIRIILLILPPSSLKSDEQLS